MERFGIPIAALLAACLSACAPAQPASGSAGPVPEARPLGDARHGQAFAAAHCAQCHATKRNTVSANPQAPPFEDIASRPGVTGDTLHQFLKDAHNFPEAMQFRLSPQDTSDLSAHFMTLRSDSRRPSP